MAGDDGKEMGPRKITLRKDDHCVVCAHPVSAQSQAWWDDATRSITCPTCAATLADVAHTVANGPGSPRPAHGVPVAPLPAEPRSTSSWATARGTRLASKLRHDLAGRAVVLDDRWVPPTKTRIDHLVIAASGVWIVDMTQQTGKVVHREVGSYLRTETRLFVDGRDRTALVAGLDEQVGAVRAALSAAGMGTVPVRAALCFTTSEWGLLARPFTINGVLVTWASKLAPRILDGPAGHDATPMHLAAVLSAALPVAA
jgi:hypothetical protein